MLDGDSRIMLVGNPTYNKAMFALYLKSICGKRLESTDCNMTTIGLGSFGWKEPQYKSVFISNTTNLPWSVDTVRTSCDCTTAMISQSCIEPHGSAQVEVVYKADKPGAFLREVYLDINGERAKQVIAVEGVAVGD